MARGVQPTVKAREARVFAMLSEGKRHDDIAAAVGLSVRRVEDIAVKFRAELVAQSDATKQAAIDGALLAKQYAREHALRAMELLAEQVGDEDLAPADRRAAAIALLDRAGVSAKAEMAVTMDVLSPETAAMVAVVVMAEGKGE